MAWQHRFNRQDPIKAQHITIRLGHLKLPHTTDDIVQRLADVDAGRFKFGREFRGALYMEAIVPVLPCGDPRSMPSIEEQNSLSRLNIPKRAGSPPSLRSGNPQFIDIEIPPEEIGATLQHRCRLGELNTGLIV